MPTRLTAAALLVVGALWLGAGTAGAQEEAPELVSDSATVVVVDPESASVTVTHTYSFENIDGEQVFSGFFEILPVDAGSVIATSGGEVLPAVSLPGDSGFAEWLVTFPQPLQPGASVDVEVSWQESGLRGDLDEFERVSRDFVAIDPYAVGHRGATSLTVVVPGAWEVALADGYAVERTDDELRLTAVDAVAVEYVALPVVLEAPERFETSIVQAGPVDITVATADGVSTWLGSELTPLVEGLAGWIPLDPPADVVFRQGYTAGAGLRRDGDTLVLPLDPSPVVAARAVATAWLAPMTFADEDLRDDLATALADRVAADEGLVAAPRAGTWSSATAALVSVSDEDTMRTIIAALDSGVPAYGGADDTFISTPVDWRRFTDVAEHLGGIASAGDAMRRSASADQIAELDRRAVALVNYRALESRAAPWLMPPLLRDAMAAWEFDRFAANQGSVSDLVGARDEMITAAELVELDIGDHVRERFESASTSMDDAWTLLVEQRESLDHVAEALRLDTGDRGLLSSLGMAGRDAPGQREDMQDAWDAGEFVDAAERAEHLVEDYEASVGRGTLRLLGPLAVVVAAIAIVQWLRRRLQVRKFQPAEA